MGSLISRRSRRDADRHLREIGRALICRGQTEGWPPESSDDEWEDHISRGRGHGRGGLLQEQGGEVDGGLDVAGIVQHAFQVYDAVTGRVSEDEGDIQHSDDGGLEGDEVDSERGRTWRPPTERISADDHLRFRHLRETFRYNGSVPRNEDLARRYGVNWVAALWRLPYWKELPIRHTLDTMHIERNFSANILNHLFGEKDTLAARRDMEDVGRMPDS